MDLFSDSKFGAELFQQACTLLGRDPENTTEAELHQAMVDAGTIQAHAESTAKAAAKVEVDAAAADVVRLTAELDAANEQIEALQTQANEATASVAEVEEKLTAANSALAVKVRECNTLAAEVARLTAGKLPASATAVDADNQFTPAPAGGGVGIDASEIDRMFFAKRPTAN